MYSTGYLSCQLVHHASGQSIIAPRDNNNITIFLQCCQHSLCTVYYKIVSDTYWIPFFVNWVLLFLSSLYSGIQYNWDTIRPCALCTIRIQLWSLGIELPPTVRSLRQRHIAACGILVVSSNCLQHNLKSYYRHKPFL